jgi:hypothetical protein
MCTDLAELKVLGPCAVLRLREGIIQQWILSFLPLRPTSIQNPREQTQLEKEGEVEPVHVSSNSPSTPLAIANAMQSINTTFQSAPRSPATLTPDPPHVSHPLAELATKTSHRRGFLFRGYGSGGCPLGVHTQRRAGNPPCTDPQGTPRSACRIPSSLPPGNRATPLLCRLREETPRERHAS